MKNKILIKNFIIYGFITILISCGNSFTSEQQSRIDDCAEKNDRGDCECMMSKSLASMSSEETEIAFNEEKAAGANMQLLFSAMGKIMSAASECGVKIDME